MAIRGRVTADTSSHKWITPMRDIRTGTINCISISAREPDASSGGVTASIDFDPRNERDAAVIEEFIRYYQQVLESEAEAVGK